MAENAQDRLPRLLALVPWLSKRPGVTMTHTAKHFGVTIDQLTTDLYQLVVCGVPGYGPDQLVDIDFYDGEQIWVTDPLTLSTPMRLTPDELTAHVVALRLISQLPGLAQNHELGVLAAKLDHAATESGILDLHELVRAEGDVDPKIQDVIAQSMSDGLKLKFEYMAGNDSVTHRVVSPIRVFRIDDNIYLEALCDQAEAIRQFRVDRIHHISILSDRPAEVSLETLESNSQVLFPRGAEAIDLAPRATVQISEQVRWLSEENWIETDFVNTDVLRVPYLSEEWLVRWVLGFGGEIQIIEPKTLGERVLNTIRGGIARLGEVT